MSRGKILGSNVGQSSYSVLNEQMALVRGDGFSRPSRYEVLLLPPTGTKGTGGDSINFASQEMRRALGDQTVRRTSMRCESISFPGRNLDTTPDTNIYGPTREIVDGYSFANVSASFQCGIDMREKLYFETWQRLAYNVQTWAMQYYEDYVGSVQIFQLDENNIARYGVELVEAFPKTIAEQSLGYATTNEIHKISVTFSYRYWKNLNDEADLPKPIETRVANTAERNLVRNLPATKTRLIFG